MRNLLILLMTILTFVSCKENSESHEEVATQTLNFELKEKLEEILTLDQGVRKLLQENLSQEEKKDILAEMNLPEQSLDNGVYTLMHNIDSVNLNEVEKIISKHGYPGKSLVGEPANNTVFFVIQHSDKIEKYLPIIRKAAENGDISNKKLAMMEDRHLMRKGKEQLYGTQIRGLNKDGEWIHFVWPVKNPDSINKLRKSIGLGSIEEYANQFDIDYEVMTLEQVNKLK